MSTTLILDSTFLVDFEREQRRKVHAGAVGFLKAHADHSLAITFTIAGELAAGESLGSDRDAWLRFLFVILVWGFPTDGKRREPCLL